MIRAIKNYRAFTRWEYRLFMLLVLPGLFLALNCVGIFKLGSMGIGSVMVPCLLILYMADTMTDILFMGGFYAKHNSSLEFLQSSNNFKRMMRDVIIIDIIRRMLLFIGSFGIIYALGFFMGEDMELFTMFSYMPFLLAILSQVASMVGRHFTLWNYAFACAAVGMVVASMCIIFMTLYATTHAFLLNVILAVIAIIVAVISVGYTMKKVRDSYYDK